MQESRVLKKRIKVLQKQKTEGDCVLYVMSRDQRVRDNHALLAAQKHAIAKKLPLAVVFCLYEKSGFRAREHYQFMIQGLQEVEAELVKLKIPFMMVIGDPIDRLMAVMHHTKPDAVYFDFSPLRGPQITQRSIAEVASFACYVVDTHNTVPVWQLSDKQEVAAYTLRPKMHRLLADYLVEPEQLMMHPYPWPGPIQTLATLQPKIQSIVDALEKNGVKMVIDSGEQAARKQLDAFVSSKLHNYMTDRNDPSKSVQSNLSPYLHFGQISSLRIALELRKILIKEGNDLHLLESPKMPQCAQGLKASIDSLLEEMIVRKELSDNFCYFNQNYDSLEGAPLWAQDTLKQHAHDPREFLYSYDALRDAATHDPAWNAAQMELTRAGKIHGYMRMYWAKKVLEWSESADLALRYLIRLNDRYSLDGGDPNGYAGIMWSIAGVHDRPWIERPIFGKIRYMNYAGLKRKFDIAVYETRWQ